MKSPARRRKAALAFIFVTVLIDMLAFGMIIPVLPMLVQNFVGGNAARAAEMYGVFGTAWALMQFIFSPVQGSLSDHFGRRTVILISCAGLGLDFILMALAPNLWWLLVGRVISGITAASFSTAGAYISDVTPPEKRAASFGIIGAAFGVGFVLGPALGGLLGAISPRLPFWASAFMALANVCWGLFVLPESLPKEKRVPFAWKNANPLGALKLLRSHPMLAGLAVSYFLINLAHVVLPSTTVLYMHYRYGWDTRAVGHPAGRRRRLLAHRPGLLGEAGGEVAQGTARDGRGSDIRCDGLRHLWPGTHRTDFLDRRAGDGPVGNRHALAANHHDADWWMPPSRGVCRARWRASWAWRASSDPRVHPDLRRLHQYACGLGAAGRALSAGGGAGIRRHAAGLAHHSTAGSRPRPKRRRRASQIANAACRKVLRSIATDVIGRAGAEPALW